MCESSSMTATAIPSTLPTLLSRKRPGALGERPTIEASQRFSSRSCAWLWKDLPSTPAVCSRRGTVIGQQDNGALTITEAEVPLSEMFGYATTLRSATQGKADFTMEFSRYLPVPEAVEEELIAKAAKAKALP